MRERERKGREGGREGGSEGEKEREIKGMERWVKGGRPGIDGFALDHFCLSSYGQDLCKRGTEGVRGREGERERGREREKGGGSGREGGRAK